MDGLEVGWLETLLEKRAREKSVARVLELGAEKALGPGENYTSDILRIQAKVVMGSGRITKRTMIAKNKSDRAADLIERYRLFDSETKMYSVVFPLMEELMEDFGDTNYYLWADYYGATDKYLLFEDLKAKGFRLTDRHSGQDLNHARLTMKNLGRFHAMSVVLVNRGAISGNLFPPSVFTRNDDIINKLFNGGVQILADTIETTWDPEWKKIASKLRSFGNSVGSKLEEIYHQECGQLKVLNHGDFWVNNMLFRYEPDSNFPIEQRFVDYQCPHYNSYAWDILNFFHSSLSPSLRKEHGKELVSTYHRSLVSTLKYNGFAADNTPTLEDVGAEIERHFPFALVASCTFLPLTISDPADAFDLSDLTDESAQGIHKKSVYLSEKYVGYIKADLEYFIRKGVL